MGTRNDIKVLALCFILVLSVCEIHFFSKAYLKLRSVVSEYICVPARPSDPRTGAVRREHSIACMGALL